MIEKLLDLFVYEFKESNINLYSKSIDGRINSSVNEEEVINFLISNKNVDRFLKSNNFETIIPNAREWYDIAFKYENDFYPINIKVTDLSNNSADNLNCKLGIYYVLVGSIPRFKNELNWSQYFYRLSKDMKPNDADYYFLVINKKDPRDTFWSSLRNITSLSPNGNNLPFQCCWNKNRNRDPKNYENTKEIILSCLKESVEKRSKILLDFQKYIK